MPLQPPIGYDTPGGFDLRGIHPIGTCRVVTGKGTDGKDTKCGKRFERAGDYFLCPEHKIPATYYLIDFHFKGVRIRRATDLNGDPLNTLQKASDLLGQAKREIRAKTFNPSKWITRERHEFTFNYLVDKWLKEKLALMERGRRAPSYTRILSIYIDRYFKPFFKGDVREIRRQHIKDFMEQLPSLSPKYTKNLMDALRSFFKWMEDGELIDKAPAFDVIELNEYEPEVLSPEVQMMILAEIPERHKPIFAFMFYQGARPGEVRALKWKDIKGDVVTYRRTWSHYTLMERTKGKNIRQNLLFPETCALLPKRGFDEEFVFTIFRAGKKNPYYDKTMREIYQKAIEAVNEKKGLNLSTRLYEHTKHSFGTQNINNGVDPYLIKDWFGHTNIKTTERYAKLKVVDAFRKITQIRKKQAVNESSIKESGQS